MLVLQRVVLLLQQILYGLDHAANFHVPFCSFQGQSRRSLAQGTHREVDWKFQSSFQRCGAGSYGKARS